VSPGLLQLDVLRLQSVQNAAVRLVSGAQRYDHITPVLQELHWLPVRRQVDFKMATLVYLSLSGMAPPYLAVDCQLVSIEGRRQLRSANSRTCVVRRTYNLPAHLRQNIHRDVTGRTVAANTRYSTL